MVLHIIVIACCMFGIGLIVSMDKMYTELYNENKRLRNKLYYEMVRNCEGNKAESKDVIIDSVAREL